MDFGVLFNKKILEVKSINHEIEKKFKQINKKMILGLES